MVGHTALRTLTTLGAETRVLALRVDTGLVLATLRVRSAAGNTEPVLADVAIITVPVAVTQRTAGALDTDLVEQTVVIGGGAGDGTLAIGALETLATLEGADTGLDRVGAGSGGVTGQTRGTTALCLMVAHGAHSIGATGGQAGAAGVSALVVDASLRGWTAGAGAASQDTSDAPAYLLAVTVLVHPTHGLAQSVVTDLVVATGLVIEADILTELAVAHLPVRTLSIAGAYLRLLDTGHHRSGVGQEARGTGALGTVVDHLALGIGSTGGGTGVSASVVDTSVGFRTVRVLATSHNTHLVEANMSKETVIVNTASH